MFQVLPMRTQRTHMHIKYILCTFTVKMQITLAMFSVRAFCSSITVLTLKIFACEALI